MPTAEQKKQKSVLFLLTAGILLVLIVLGFALTHAKKIQKDFRDQMAQRLDAEAKVTKMENERAAFLSQQKALQEQLVQAKNEIEDLKADLNRAKDEKASLAGALEKIKTEIAKVPSGIAPASGSK
jgi:chromosome segregation ATPase